MSPLKNAAGKAGASMKSSFSSGARAGFTASGGKISGSSGAAAPTAAATAPTGAAASAPPAWARSEEHTTELQSLMRTPYAVFCLKKQQKKDTNRDRRTVYD